MQHYKIRNFGREEGKGDMREEEFIQMFMFIDPVLPKWESNT
jgi:hypothetical protein